MLIYINLFLKAESIRNINIIYKRFHVLIKPLLYKKIDLYTDTNKSLYPLLRELLVHPKLTSHVRHLYITKVFILHRLIYWIIPKFLLQYINEAIIKPILTNTTKLQNIKFDIFIFTNNNPNILDLPQPQIQKWQINIFSKLSFL